MRESSGGLPRVQALGLYLDDLGCAQVSMNLLDLSGHSPVGGYGRRSVSLATDEGVAAARIGADRPASRWQP